jgi:hypothetical protein
VLWYEHLGRSLLSARVSTAGVVTQTSAGFGVLEDRGEESTPDPALAFDGTNFLAVWWDDPGTSNTNDTPILRDDAFGGRISSAGANVGSPFTVSKAANQQEFPAVAFDGTNYLVVWTDARSATTTGSDILATRVRPDGTVLDPAGIAVSTAIGAQREPAVAFDGTRYLVTWRDSRDLPALEDIFAARVTTAGVVQDTAGINVSSTDDVAFRPAVAFDGTNFLVAWEGGPLDMAGTDLHANRVSPAGVRLAASPIVVAQDVASENAHPSVASNGSESFVVWTDNRVPFGSNDIYGARITSAGAVRDPVGVPISTSPGNQFHPSVAWNGTRYLATWVDERNAGFPDSDVYGARVSTLGAVQDPAGIPISTAAHAQEEPAVAANGLNFLVIWDDRRSGTNSDVYAARIGDGGVVNDPNGFVISATSDDELFPRVVRGPNERFAPVYQRAALDAPLGATRVFLRSVSK